MNESQLTSDIQEGQLREFGQNRHKRAGIFIGEFSFYKWNENYVMANVMTNGRIIMPKCTIMMLCKCNIREIYHDYFSI